MSHYSIIASVTRKGNEEFFDSLPVQKFDSVDLEFARVFPDGTGDNMTPHILFRQNDRLGLWQSIELSSHEMYALISDLDKGNLSKVNFAHPDIEKPFHNLQQFQLHHRWVISTDDKPNPDKNVVDQFAPQFTRKLAALSSGATISDIIFGKRNVADGVTKAFASFNAAIKVVKPPQVPLALAA